MPNEAQATVPAAAPSPMSASLPAALPDDDLARLLVLAQSDSPDAPHIGLVGDTYTILLGGKDTAGNFCLVDMHVPPGGGPPPHRHDFEETFVVLEGAIEATFRGAKSTACAGQTLHIPANAPHQFHNASRDLRARRAGRILRAGRRARRDPHHASAEARRKSRAGTPRQSRRLGAKIQN
jgi:quercetin dioxygenase-like cupin family protein